MDVSLVVAIALVVVLATGIILLARSRRRVMRYHDIDTPQVHPFTHGGGGDGGGGG